MLIDINYKAAAEIDVHLTPELFFTILGLALSIVAMVYSWANSGKRMENRMTVLEANQLTAEDRRCLHDLDTKMATIWKFFERDLPAALHSPHTPELDLLLDKAKEGLGQMKVDDVKRLYVLVAEECENETKTTAQIRVIALAAYRSFLQHEISALNILI